MRGTCHWCNDPATTTVILDNIKNRLCDNCAAEAESEFTDLNLTKD